MLWLLDFFIVICLALLFLEDAKNREVSLYILLAMSVLLFCRSFVLLESPLKILELWLLNTLVFVVELLLLKMYFSYRNKMVEPIINRYLGLGDVLFISLLGLSFSTYNFVVFLLFSLSTALAASFFLIRYKKIESKSIPLVSLLSIPFVLLLILADRFSLDLFSDLYLLNFVL